MLARSIERAVAVSFCFISASAAVAFAQGALVLHDPLSARSAAMGETGAADNSDPANIYFNPANVVGAPRAYLNGSHWKPVPDLADDVWFGRVSGGIRHALNDNTAIGVDVTYGRLDYGESIATDPFGAPIGVYQPFEDYIALTAGAGLGLGRDWEVRVGVAGKRYTGKYPPSGFTNDTAEIELDALAFDIGVTIARQSQVGDWQVIPAAAVAYVNSGGEIETPFGDDPLPTRLHFGSSVLAESPTMHVLGADVPVLAMVYNIEATDRMHDGDFSWGIGGEIAFAQIVFLRAGTLDIDDDPQFEDDYGEFANQSGWGIGAGIPFGAVRTRFDYTKVSDSYAEKKLGFSIDWIF